ncbi:MAG: D-glycero-beta-D-manno-heptose 1-phosphate adenylyltransferase [Candidatus Omnitrophica bacterium]|nr:D-glycero-beta-D-manno-heptose 1-phosphate adenylyltransferase [Candidatus Omnitrophota bacterium]
MHPKIINLKKLKRILPLKRKNKTIAFTNGCFDILHYGHIKYLSQAKKLADILIVGVNSDTSVKKIKGEGRPINPLRQRMEVVAALSSVDYVVSFTQPTPWFLIKTIKPDILIKGGDWKKKNIVGSDIITSYGGKVLTLPYVKGVSTTDIINKIIKRFEKKR